MSVCRDEAVALARAYLKEHLPACPVNYDAVTARLERAEERHGGSPEGMGGTYWVLVFDLLMSDGVVRSPSEKIVFVDEQTGKAANWRTF